jgi:protein YIPF6
MLSTTLSLTAPGSSASLVFAAVFVIVWCGAAMVTINAQLLGGSISFFQSVCILGYCVFPLTLAAILCVVLSFLINQVSVSAYYMKYSSLPSFPCSHICSQLIVKAIVVGIGFVWSTKASVVFMGQVISEERRTLAVYPVFFFYTFISWMIMVQ